MILFVYQLVIIAGIFVTDVVLAGDGDLNYSSPYITVDPETGQLVTKNPGPHLKMHTQGPSMQMQTDNPELAATTAASQNTAAGSDEVSAPVEEPQPLAIILIVSAVAIGGTLFAFRRAGKR